MSKLKLQAAFEHKPSNFQTSECVVEQVVKLPGRDFDFFKNNLLRDYDFIRDNVDSMFVENGKSHCLLVVGEERKDGVLVESSGYAYARYAAFIPHAADILTVHQEREKPSVLGKIQEARLTPTPPKEQHTPQKDTRGAER